MLDGILILTRDLWVQDSRKELSSTEVVDMTRSGQRPALDLDLIDERTENPEDDLSDQVPTLAIHEKSSLQDVAGRVSSDQEGTTSDQAGRLEPPQPTNRDEVLVNGVVGSPASRMKNGGKVSSSSITNRPFGFGQNQDTCFHKVDSHYFFSWFFYLTNLMCVSVFIFYL